MSETPRQIEGATGGQEIQPYAAGGSSDVQPRPAGATVLQQQGEENVAIQHTHFHFNLAPTFIIHGGNVVSSPTYFQGNQVGSIGVSSGASGPPILQFSGTPGSLTGGTSDAEQQRSLAKLLEGLPLSEEVKEKAMKALEDLVAKATTKQEIEQSGETTKTKADSSTEIHIPTDEIIKSMNATKLDDDIEKHVKQGFEALIRDDDSEKTTMDFIKAYEEEDATIQSEFYKDRNDLKEFVDKTWDDTFFGLVSTTCDRHLADNIEIKRALAQICTNISKKLCEQIKYESYLTKFVPCAANIYSMGKDFASHKKYIHAVISFYTCVKLHELSDMSGKLVEDMNIWTRQTIFAGGEMVKQETMKKVIIDHVIPIMREMRNSVRSIQSASHSAKIEYEAACLGRIGLFYSYCGENQQYANEVESAIKLLETEFKEKAKDLRIYGLALNNAGVAYGRLGQIPKAIELYKKSLEAKESATDYPTEEERKKDIERTRYNLRRNEATLKK